MSFIEEVLITIDDKEKSKEELERFFKGSYLSAVFSAAGKLITSQLVEARREKYTTIYKTTKKGDLEIKRNLEPLKDFVKNKKPSWILIVVKASKRKRVALEKARYLLKKSGFSSVKNSVYIGKESEYKRLKPEISNIEVELIGFRISRLPKKISAEPSLVWNVKKIDKLYQKIILKAEKFLQNPPSDNDVKRVEAKKIIYDLAGIVRIDPFLFASTHRDRSKKIYRKIRPFCYE